jgi:FkbM family methyltransferase
MSPLIRAMQRYLLTGRRPGDELSPEASLIRLKQIGFTPAVIYDLGAHRGDWTREISKIYPSAEYLLFEANADHVQYLRHTGHRYFISALGSDDSQNKPFYLPKKGNSLGASFYMERTPHYDDGNLLIRSIPIARLDTLVREQVLPLPNLMKLDVQGAEIDVLTGAPNCVMSCTALITEVSLVNYNKGAPLFADVVSWITQRGFFCVDICELHRWKHNCIFQIDLLFVREQLFNKFSSLGF